jgi:hypothetical protein
VTDAARALETRGVRCETREVRAEPGWQFNANPSFVSPELTETTLAWCLERLARPGTAAASATAATTANEASSETALDAPPPAKSPVGRIEIR